MMELMLLKAWDHLTVRVERVSKRDQLLVKSDTTHTRTQSPVDVSGMFTAGIGSERECDDEIHVGDDWVHILKDPPTRLYASDWEDDAVSIDETMDVVVNERCGNGILGDRLCTSHTNSLPQISSVVSS